MATFDDVALPVPARRVGRRDARFIATVVALAAAGLFIVALQVWLVMFATMW